jgi:hypothetical protein
VSPSSPRQQRPKPGTFDRIRAADESAKRSDPQGKQALFSGVEQPPSLGSAAIDCDKCGRRTIVSLPRLLQLSATGVHAPVPGKGHRAWLKCPACEQRAWVSVTIGH